MLRDLLDQGAQAVGDPTQCHAVAIDGRAPKFDGGIASRLDCVPFSVVLNQQGQRFYDEGEDVWPKRYAIWGRLVAAQPEQVGYVIIDSRSLNLFMPSLYPPLVDDSLEGLLGQMDLPVDAAMKTIGDLMQPAATISVVSARPSWMVWRHAGWSHRRPTGRGRSSSHRSMATACAPG